MSDIALRWAAFRKAVEAGYDYALTYDYFVHPATRVSITIVEENL